MNNAKRGKISPFQFFAILTVSRIVVSLTYIQSVTVGIMSFDVALGLIFAAFFTIILSLPAYYCAVKNKNPLDNRWVALLYLLYFSYFCGINVSRFAYFAISRLDTKISMPILCVAIVVLGVYCACLKIEGIARFGSLCAVTLFIAIVGAVLLNINKIEVENFYPLIRNSRFAIFNNTLLFTSNSVEPAIIIALGSKVNGNILKPICAAVFTSFSAIVVLVLLAVGIMGHGALLQSFPFFTVFQLAELGSMARLDMLHTCFWALALLVKTAVLIYCGSCCLKGVKRNNACIISGIIAAAVAVFITAVVGMAMVEITKIVSRACFAVFTVLIPLATLMIKRRKKREAQIV